MSSSENFLFLDRVEGKEKKGSSMIVGCALRVSRVSRFRSVRVRFQVQASSAGFLSGVGFLSIIYLGIGMGIRVSGILREDFSVGLEKIV